MAELPEIGSPGLDDATSQQEKVFNQALKQLRGIVETTIPELANRPFGSTKESREQRLLEYNSAPRGEARKLANDQRLEMYIAQEGAMRGWQLFIEDIQDLERG